MSWLLLASLVISTAAALILVPLVREIAVRIGMIDKPDLQRKLHTKPIALGGGLAVFAALLVGFGTTMLIDHHFAHSTLEPFLGRWKTLFAAAAAILVVGLVDDRWALRGRQKLLLQCLIVAIVVGRGTVITQLSVLGYEFQLGHLEFPVTMLWLLVAINALNLIDGADGMATTVGCIICAGLGILSCRSGVSLNGVICFALSGALLGFLAYNRPPASIFLGDAGSMMIGFFVGVLAIWSSVKESTILASAPVAILAIPLFDSSAAILRRWLTGRSIYATDRAHLHHLLQSKFGSRGMLVVVAALCLITTALSVVSTYYDLPWLAAIGVLFVLGLLVVTRSFGYAEFRLVASRVYNFSRSFSTPVAQCDTKKLQRRHLLQGTGAWETIWEPLVEFARSHELASIKIDLNLAWIHEGYHASWQSVRLPEKANQLTMCVPLFTRQTVDGSELPIGKLDIIASASAPEIYTRIAEFVEHLAELNPQIDWVIEQLEQQPKRKPAAFPWPRQKAEVTLAEKPNGAAPSSEWAKVSAKLSSDSEASYKLK
ncbi:glycosyltransferase family 4 protein [Novipirellula artificiosorum]|uniref:WecA-like glycosyltransferase n=1 Tax=Novipirellula artificiosorum TaxID=2528016 RepID=A0A5C6DC99_9BACT|nr:MraY family glycosyltransferase [Novipirellula artificiosorum]TWU33397.1 WecA-like glycosyltransferase [Novipirellula artificiosorum]